MTTRLLFAVGATLSILAWSSAAPSHSGEILSVEGKVEATTATGIWESAAAGRTLRVGDGIRTGEYSRTAIRLPAGSILRVGELTTLKVQASPGNPQRPSAVVTKGTLMFLGRTRPEELDFSTPVATGAIKGTEVVIHVDDSGASSFTVLEGDIEIVPARGAGATSTSLSSGQLAEVSITGAVTRTSVIDAVAPVRWALYYPTVLDPAIAEPASTSPWRASWMAYRSGALPLAIQFTPSGTSPAADPERLLAAALRLAAGAHQLPDLAGMSGEPAQALRLLSDVVQQGSRSTSARGFVPNTATGWLAVSYARQSAADLNGALLAARNATASAPDFGYAWARVGELEFAVGRRSAAEVALKRALAVAPDMAYARSVLGYVAAAAARRVEADTLFTEALRQDPALAPARLGLGIIAHGRGDTERGRRELIAAAAMDPTQSLPRSYLAKTWLNARDSQRARNELAIAGRLDATDPTPPLYSAFLAQQENRPVDAIVSLERSIALNDNRRVYRSRLLLDEDRAVRRADLAEIYASAGSPELAFREASRAIREDPANFSAHLFLASAYDQLRDPLRINLRFETPWSGSLLLARLLAPATTGALTPALGLGEYTRLFEPARFTLRGDTTLLDSGEKRVTAIHTGNFERSYYSAEFRALRFPGERANHDFARSELNALVGHQVSPDGTVIAQVSFNSVRGGDLRTGIDDNMANVASRFREKLLPLAYVGYRHHWRPGSDTLFLGARLSSDFAEVDPSPEHVLFVQEPDLQRITPLEFPLRLSTHFTNRFTLHHAELTHFEQFNAILIQAGVRAQSGRFVGTNSFDPLGAAPGNLFPALFDETVRESLRRISVYGYFAWKFAPGWSLHGGVTADRIAFPANLFTIPITSGQVRDTRVSPKIALLWDQGNWSFRAAHTESVGGITFEESFRLEPVQFAGFTQGVRSLIPEGAAGGTVAPRFILDGAGVSYKAVGKFHCDLEVQQRRSTAPRLVGTFVIPPLPARPRATREFLTLSERQLSGTATWLIHSQCTLVAGINLIDTQLIQEIPESPTLFLDQRSKLLSPLFRFNWTSPSGFFGRTETTWYRQRHVIGLGEETRRAWSSSFTTGYRARAQRWSVELGCLNLWNSRLALDALSVLNPLPQKRTFFVRLRWSL